MTLTAIEFYSGIGTQLDKLKENFINGFSQEACIWPCNELVSLPTCYWLLIGINPLVEFIL